MSLPAPDSATTVLVTGASSGIGRELSRELARRGHHVTLVARRRDRLAELADELGAAEPLPCDLADARARGALAARLRAPGGRRVVGVCNNAGFGTFGRFDALPAAREAEQVAVNVDALHELTRAFVQDMVVAGTGAILNVASIVGFAPIAGFATYTATKAFVLAFSQALHAELVGTGVSCTALCPGAVSTEFASVAQLQDFERTTINVGVASPARVARAGVRGMVHGRRTIVPGVSAKALAAGARIAPRAILLPLTRLAGGPRLAIPGG